jgi:Domain of unknown function (DUF1707)
VLLMAGPGDEIAAGRGRLRASHADREQVISILKAAFVQGMLAKDEFDLRVGQAFASRTYADLAALTTDITPARLTRARPPEPARESVNKKKKAVAALSCATLAIVGMLAALPPIPDGSPFAVPVLMVFCVLCMAVSTGWLLLLHAWIDERAGRQSAHGLPPGAGGQPSRRLPPADPGRQLPPAGHGDRHAAEAARSRRPHQRRPCVEGALRTN